MLAEETFLRWLAEIGPLFRSTDQAFDEESIVSNRSAFILARQGKRVEATGVERGLTNNGKNEHGGHPVELSTLDVIVVSHISGMYATTEFLESFLRKKVRTLGVVLHPLFYAARLGSSATLYIRDNLRRGQRFPRKLLPETLMYVVDAALTIYWTLGFRRRFSIYIGFDCLNACLGLLLRKIRVVQTTIFYCIDLVDRRFENPVKNAIYHVLDITAAKRSDFVWNLSESMALIRTIQGVPNSKNLVVPHGVDTSQFKTVVYPPIRRSLVFIGALSPAKGTELVIDSFPEILAEVPGAELFVTGRTPEHMRKYAFEEKLTRMEGTRYLGVLSRSELVDLLCRCAVALAPYHPNPKDDIAIARFADPGRVKDYLAAGLPVIITRVPGISSLIERRRAGLVIGYDGKELVEAASRMLTDDELFLELRRNAISLGKEYDSARIFENALAHCLTVLGDKRRRVPPSDGKSL